PRIRAGAVRDADDRPPESRPRGILRAGQRARGVRRSRRLRGESPLLPEARERTRAHRAGLPRPHARGAHVDAPLSTDVRGHRPRRTGAPRRQAGGFTTMTRSAIPLKTRLRRALFDAYVFVSRVPFDP